MIGRHLKIGAKARFTVSEKTWAALMAKVNGSVKIGAEAQVVILPADAVNQWLELIGGARRA